MCLSSKDTGGFLPPCDVTQEQRAPSEVQRCIAMKQEKTVGSNRTWTEEEPHGSTEAKLRLIHRAVPPPRRCFHVARSTLRALASEGCESYPARRDATVALNSNWIDRKAQQPLFLSVP